MKLKSSLSVIAAAVLAASMAVSAGATDYSADPSYPLPPRPAGSSGSSSSSSASTPSSSGNTSLPAAGTAASNPLSVIDKSAVSSALRRNAPIYSSYKDAAIKANAMALLANREDSVLRVITERYTAVIRGESVTKAKDISLAIKMTKNTKQGAMILRTEQQGEFGCTADIIISAKYYAQCGVDLNDAHVFFVDENKQITDRGAIVTDVNGNIVVSMTTGGKYIIM